jgi:hypothetical protein
MQARGMNPGANARLVQEWCCITRGVVSLMKRELWIAGPANPSEGITRGLLGGEGNALCQQMGLCQ